MKRLTILLTLGFKRTQERTICKPPQLQDGRPGVAFCIQPETNALQLSIRDNAKTLGTFDCEQGEEKGVREEKGVKKKKVSGTFDCGAAGIAGGGLDDAAGVFLKSTGKRGLRKAVGHGLRHARREAAITAAFGAYGYFEGGGSWNSALDYANVGNMVGATVAGLTVKCFVEGTPVATGTLQVDVTVRPVEEHGDYQSVWIASGLAVIVASRLFGDERRGRRGLIPRVDVGETVLPEGNEKPAEDESANIELDFTSVCQDLDF